LEKYCFDIAVAVAATAAAVAVADALIQRLVDDPNTFLRTTQTLGAESASVQDITAEKRHRLRLQGMANLHAILWPTLAGSVLLLGALLYMLWRWRRRRLLRFTQLAVGGLDIAVIAAAGGVTGLMNGLHSPRMRRLCQLGHHNTGSSSGSDGSSDTDGGQVCQMRHPSWAQ
jgi:hypothetical protein